MFSQWIITMIFYTGPFCYMNKNIIEQIQTNEKTKEFSWTYDK